MMHFKKTRDWLEVILWVGIIITLIVLGYSLWYNYVDLSIAALIIMLAMVFLLGYFKYTQLLSLKRKFVIVQETFTTLMLIYFSYNYFRQRDETPGQKELAGTAKKFEDVYEKSRYQLTLPLIFTALKTFGEIKNIKNIIMSEVKDFSSEDGFNLDNAENITKELGNLVQKIQQLSSIVTKGFTFKKSLEDVMDEKADYSSKSSKSSSSSNVTKSASNPSASKSNKKGNSMSLSNAKKTSAGQKLSKPALVNRQMKTKRIVKRSKPNTAKR